MTTVAGQTGGRLAGSADGHGGRGSLSQLPGREARIVSTSTRSCCAGGGSTSCSAAGLPRRTTRTAGCWSTSFRIRVADTAPAWRPGARAASRSAPGHARRSRTPRRTPARSCRPGRTRARRRVSGGRSMRSGSFSRGKMIALQPCPLGGERLLPQAADRQDRSGERDLAGHADVGCDRLAADERHDRGRHRDARRRAVLRHRAGRHVHVDVVRRRTSRPAHRASAAFERTQESAACADSCITSPSWPVIVRRPRPG